MLSELFLLCLILCKEIRKLCFWKGFFFYVNQKSRLAIKLLASATKPLHGAIKTVVSAIKSIAGAINTAMSATKLEFTNAQREKGYPDLDIIN